MNDNLKSELLKRLQQSEDAWVERKSTADDRNVKKAVVAFANSLQEGQSAVLFIGVDDKGKIVGVPNADDTQKNVRRYISGCYPAIHYQTYVLTIPGAEKEVLAVVIPASLNRPHFTGPAYIRVGSESTEASDETFRELVASQNEKARQLLKYKDRRILLRLRSESGFRYDVGAIVEACNATTVNVRDFDGYHRTLPIAGVEIFHNHASDLILVAPPPWTEEEHLREIVRRWYQFQPTDTFRLNTSHPDFYLAQQVLAHPAKTVAAISSVADGSNNVALRSLRMHLQFELKKLSDPIPRQKKLRLLEQQFSRTLTEGNNSNMAALAAFVFALRTFATSLDEVDEFIGLLRNRHPGAAHVATETILNAFFFDF